MRDWLIKLLGGYTPAEMHEVRAKLFTTTNELIGLKLNGRIKVDMWIKTQDGRCIINTDNISTISINDSYIICFEPHCDEPITIGEYGSKEAARAAFESLGASLNLGR